MVGRKDPPIIVSRGGGLDLTLIQGQDQDKGQGQDHLLPQRAALPPFLVLALTLVLVLTLDQGQVQTPPERL